MRARQRALREFTQIRRKLRVSQKEVARRCGLSQSYLSELEHGRKIGSPDLWAKLIWHLNDHEWENYNDEQEELVLELAQSEAVIVCAFLQRFSDELNFRFYCPVCKRLEPFKCYAEDNTFVPRSRDAARHDPATRMVQITCAHCLKQRLPRCGGYVVKWLGKGKIQRVLIAPQQPRASISMIPHSIFPRFASSES